MKVIVFGATGMVGRGVLRECLLDPGIDTVVTVGRRATGVQSPKLREIVHDVGDLAGLADQLRGYDACFFCLGVSSAGMTETAYRVVTYDLTMSVARLLVTLNPDMTFIYVSGAGTDSSERGRSMWARVKGATENAILRLPFKAAYMFRPGIIQPLNGVSSGTPLYRATYVVLGPFFPVLKALFPKQVTTTVDLGRAMIAVARHGAPKSILETTDITEMPGLSAVP